VTIVLGAGVYLFFQDGDDYTLPRMVRYSLTVQNTTNEFIESANLWVYGPAKQTSWQLTKEITASKKFKLTTDSLGNQIMEFNIKNLPPFGTQVINIQSQLLLASEPQSLSIKGNQKYLAAEKYIEVDNQDIQNKASQLSAANNEETLKNTFKWVSGHIKYSGYIKDDRGALYALKNRAGDCTEYAHLQTALTRANNIVSRSVGGYIVKENAVFKASDFHNWTEVYINSKWRTVDAQNRQYMKNESNYIIFRILGRSEDNRLTNTHRFAYSDQNLSVKMH